MTSKFATDGVVDVNLITPTTDAKQELGFRVVGNDGSDWIYVQADAAGITGAGYCVLVDEAFAADMIDTTNSAAGFGQFVGVAPAVFAANEFGYVQISGVAIVRVAASAAANTALNTTATAGQLDDDAGTGAEVVTGVTLTTANGGSAATAAAVLNNASVGATL